MTQDKNAKCVHELKHIAKRTKAKVFVDKISPNLKLINIWRKLCNVNIAKGAKGIPKHIKAWYFCKG